MSKEGSWINYRTGKSFPVFDHELFIREEGNAKRLGVPDNVMKAAKKFRPIQDREKFLMFLMQNAPIMRQRGHGQAVTFEYATHSRQEPIDAIWVWGKQNAGPFTQININNLATGENTQMFYQDFEESMDSGGYDAVMRAASVQPIRKKIAAELLKLSKQIIQKAVLFLF